MKALIISTIIGATVGGLIFFLTDGKKVTPYNIEITYFNGDKDTIKNIEYPTYFNSRYGDLHSLKFSRANVRYFREIQL